MIHYAARAGSLRLQAKVWPQDSTEPDAWSIDCRPEPDAPFEVLGVQDQEDGVGLAEQQNVAGYLLVLARRAEIHHSGRVDNGSGRYSTA